LRRQPVGFAKPAHARALASTPENGAKKQHTSLNFSFLSALNGIFTRNSVDVMHYTV
jgi:hypothetical protein